MKCCFHKGRSLVFLVSPARLTGLGLGYAGDEPIRLTLQYAWTTEKGYLIAAPPNDDLVNQRTQTGPAAIQAAGPTHSR